MIYTSYFGRMARLLKVFKPGQLVSIARSPPLQFTGTRGVRSYKILAPSWDLLNQWHKGLKPFDYITHFQRETLGDLNPVAIVRDLTQDYDTVVLLCYEPEGQFCHRHIVAEWLKEYTLQDVEEWNDPPRVVA